MVHYTPRQWKPAQIRRKSKSASYHANASAREELPDLRIPRQQANAWNRPINRARTKINRKFTRKSRAAQVQLQKEIFNERRKLFFPLGLADRRLQKINHKAKRRIV
jgi:hypothetical protein